MDTISGKVLLISGDVEAGRFWADALRHCGTNVAVAWSAPEAPDCWEQGDFDLILVDAYTHLDGVALCRHLRNWTVNPILLLCPCEDETRVLEVYRAGADECILKPVSPATLRAKVGAWLRHQWTVRVEALNPVEAGGIRLEPQHRQVLLASGAAVGLTNLELRVLYLLMIHRGHVLPSEALVLGAWGRDAGSDTRTLWNVVHRLRCKIEPDPRYPHMLQTAPGKGYTFCG